MMECSLDKILFFDIETAPVVEHWQDLTPEMQHLWNEKYQKLADRNSARYDENPENGWRESAVFAEFARVVCISVGFCYRRPDGEWGLRVKSFCEHNERHLLQGFLDLVGRFCNTRVQRLCGHNVKEFDIPFVCRRALIHGLKLPDALQVAGKKPWETQFLDTMELWKFGDYKNYTPLKLLTAIFGIPTPKDDIDGSQVARVFYEEQDLKRISIYCQKDVIATTQVFLRLNGEPCITEENIEHITL